MGDLTKSQPRKWTHEETELLAKLYHSTKSTEEIARILRRSIQAIHQKSSILGLEGKIHRWTKEEVITELKRLHEKLGGFNRETAKLEGKRGLVDACKSHFGGFNKALIAAGLPTNYGDFPIPDLTPEFAYLLGLVIGDGCVVEGYVLLGITEKDCELVESFSRICKQLFGRKPSITEKPERWFKSPESEKIYKGKPMKCASLGSITVSSWLVKNFKPSGKWVIPQPVFKALPEIQAGFLRGFYDAEGGVSIGTIKLSQKDEEILKRVQKMLENFGIESRVSHSKKEFCLVITGLSNFEKFRRSISFGLTRKQEKLIEWINRAKKFRESINFRVAGESRRMILEVLKERPLRLKGIASRINLDRANTHVHLKKLQMEGKIQKFKPHLRLVLWGLPEHKLELSSEEIKNLVAGKHKWSKEKIIEEARKLMLKEGHLPPVAKVPPSLRGAVERYFGRWNKLKEALMGSSG